MCAIFIRKHALAICVAICVGYFIVGLWPFDFNPPNNVGWLEDSPGISFRRPSIVYSEHALDLESRSASAD